MGPGRPPNYLPRSAGPAKGLIVAQESVIHRSL